MQTNMEKIVSLQPIIYYPKPDIIYSLKCPTGIIDISFEGVKLANIHSVNVYSHDFKKHNEDVRKIVRWDDWLSFESVETLPIHLKSEKLPPILRRVKEDNASNSLYYAKKVVFDIDTNKTEDELERLPFTLHLWNEEIQQACQTILKDIPVRKIRSSIFKPDHLPSQAFLHYLHYQFWSFNKDRLEDQTNETLGLCHIRAHFVSAFLSLYGIDSIKIFKLWDVLNWKKEKYGDKMHFHCAILLVDDNHTLWVWDPWLYSSPSLLSLKEWALDTTSPAPMAVILGNRNLIEDYDNQIQWLSFDACATPMYRRAFQGLFESATPNPPPKPLRFRFFEEGKKSLDHRDLPAHKQFICT